MASHSRASARTVAAVGVADVGPYDRRAVVPIRGCLAFGAVLPAAASAERTSQVKSLREVGAPDPPTDRGCAVLARPDGQDVAVSERGRLQSHAEVAEIALAVSTLVANASWRH